MQTLILAPVRQRRGWIGVGVVCALLGWHLTARTAAGLGVAALPRAEPIGAAGDSLLVEPDDGMSPDLRSCSARRVAPST